MRAFMYKCLERRSLFDPEISVSERRGQRMREFVQFYTFVPIFIIIVIMLIGGRP